MRPFLYMVFFVVVIIILTVSQLFNFFPRLPLIDKLQNYLPTFSLSTFLPKKQQKITAGTPQTLVVSQDLWAIAAKQKQLKQILTQNASPSAEQLAEVLYSQPLLSSQVTQKDNQWQLTTDALGTISYPLPKGIYKLSAVSLDLYDITNLPQSITIENEAISLQLGLRVGSGKIFLCDQFTTDPLLSTPQVSAPEGQQYLLVNLFHDKNNNQKLDLEEKLVPWAGITLTLEKQPETGFGKLLR